MQTCGRNKTTSILPLRVRPHTRSSRSNSWEMAKTSRKTAKNTHRNSNTNADTAYKVRLNDYLQKTLENEIIHFKRDKDDECTFEDFTDNKKIDDRLKGEKMARSF